MLMMTQAREPQRDSEMSDRGVAVAAVLWPSFLSACVASLLFFAAIDPNALSDASPLFAHLNREAGYAVGFFFFWLIAVVASGISVYLIRSAHARAADERELP